MLGFRKPVATRLISWDINMDPPTSRPRDTN